jgi:hypothetical protein
VGSFHALLVGAAAIVLIPRLILSGWTKYARTVGCFFLFNALLLAFGILGNCLWIKLVYARLYISQDTLVDFLPFVPFGQWVLDVDYGGKRGLLLNGTSLWHLRSLWAMLASAVWTLTMLTYRRILKGWPAMPASA